MDSTKCLRNISAALYPTNGPHQDWILLTHSGSGAVLAMLRASQSRTL